VANFVEQEVERSAILADYPGVDGVISLVHGTDCGMADRGEGFDVLRRTQWGYASHPNMAGVLMIGLGCEVFQIEHLKSEYGLVEGDTFRTLTIQTAGGTHKSVEAGVAAVREMLPMANKAQRETIPASELVLALQCGGSDGYSGITANPALGAAVDLLVAHGGSAILSETPEIYGAEHLLTRRARNREVGEKIVELIHWWEDYTARNGNEMNNNPSPGNKAGGLTTILEKSLGAVAKGGTTPVNEVYRYAEPVTAKGFVYMDTPGYDPVSATGQVAGGANVLCFTTGRGSAYGCKPTPSIKLATNSDIYRRMIDDMDINCGDVLDGVSIEAKGREIFNMILASPPASARNRSSWATAARSSCPGRSAQRCNFGWVIQMKPTFDFAPTSTLPRDGTAGALAGRVWRPELGGPSVVAIREDGVFDITSFCPTTSALAAATVASRGGARCRGRTLRRSRRHP
jgi:altronate hydrolase